jgi:hypothetical protein
MSEKSSEKSKKPTLFAKGGLFSRVMRGGTKRSNKLDASTGGPNVGGGGDNSSDDDDDNSVIGDGDNSNEEDRGLILFKDVYDVKSDRSKSITIDIRKGT